MIKKTTTFPLEKEVELVAIKGKIVKKKILPYGKALEIPKKKGWVFLFYELGFCSMEET